MERTASLIEAETAAAPTAPSEQPTAAPAAQRSLLARVGGFVMGLCYWAMLAASTIGPGTITLMAKGGADMHAKKNYGDACLSWTILVASVIAYTLQESAARLQILTDTSFGAAMYVHFQARSESGRPKPPQPRNAVARAMGTSSCTPNVSLVMAGLIIFANTILECAQVAGMMAAVEYYGGKGTFTRTIVSFVVCTTVAVVLFKGNIDSISKALGAVVALMAVVFTISSWAAGIDAEDFVPAMPADAADQSLGMIATTALPFNVFLASSLAQGFELKEMQTGVQFSTAVTAVISLLLIITGTAVENGPDGFHIADLAQVLLVLSTVFGVRWRCLSNHRTTSGAAHAHQPDGRGLLRRRSDRCRGILRADGGAGRLAVVPVAAQRRGRRNPDGRRGRGGGQDCGPRQPARRRRGGGGRRRSSGRWGRRRPAAARLLGPSGWAAGAAVRGGVDAAGAAIVRLGVPGCSG
jgi:hypothetical protein